MAPGLLAQVQMQGLKRFFHSLMTGEAGPLMKARLSTQAGLLEVGLGLMKPVGGAVHGTKGIHRLLRQFD
jgi:hypothetical protein